MVSRTRATLLAGLALAGLALAVLFGAVTTARGAGAVVLPLPALGATTKVVSINGSRTLLIVDLEVTNIAPGAKLLVSCDGCKRLAGAIRETSTPTTRKFRDVNWLLSAGRVIHVSVTKPAATGRFMELVSNVERRQLLFRSAGCLTIADRRERCPSPGRAVQLAVGGFTSCALLFNGGIDCWGDNAYGALGNGTTISSAVPVPVSGITTAIAVATSGYSRSACALLSGGTVDCWGSNSEGQLGDGTTSDHLTPVPVSGITTAKAISVGTGWACALLPLGRIACWGANAEGELGNGTTSNSSTPVAVPGIRDAVAIGAAGGGGLTSCALRSGGSVDCWGYNADGELGDGASGESSSAPVRVAGITNATAVSAGHPGSCALLSSGSIDCWGYNAEGELGNGTTTNSTIPVPVSGIVNATAISTGHFGSCGLLLRGRVACWGHNFYGELGNGTTADSATPVFVRGIARATEVSAGDGSACALLAGGRVFCWGYNAYGELGNGTTVNTTTPVMVSNLP